MPSRRHQLQQLMAARRRQQRQQQQPQKIEGISGDSPFRADPKGDAMDNHHTHKFPAALQKRRTMAAAASSRPGQEGGCSWSTSSMTAAGLRKVQYTIPSVHLQRTLFWWSAVNFFGGRRSRKENPRANLPGKLLNINNQAYKKD